MTDISVAAHCAAAAAAIGAGMVNAIAGGGTLISFPLLTAIGVPSVRANATNTVSLMPGYVGGVVAQRDDLGGLGIMLIAVLGLFSDLKLNKLNAIKLLLAFVVNLFAAMFLSFSGKIEWTLVAVMAPAALLGGNLGGRLASSLPPKRLRVFVIAFGFIVTIIYFVK